MSPTATTSARYGTWTSPVGAAQVAGAMLRLGQLGLIGDSVFWTEGRPEEQGRNVLVRCDAAGTRHDLTPAPFNVRSRAHEYGGGAFALLAEAQLFCNDADQQIYRIDGAGAARPLTDEPSQRYADLLPDPARGRLIAVREDQRGAAPIASLVAIDLDSAAVRVLAEGQDFYASPCLSPDGRLLAWLSWRHPDMPWDATELWCAELTADGMLTDARKLAGGDDESIFQPQWSPAGELHFVSDRSGWWNLYRLRDAQVQALHPMTAEFGVPQWVFGMSTYGFEPEGGIVCSFQRDGVARLATLDADTDRLETLDTPFCAIESLRVDAGRVIFIGATPTEASAVVCLDLRSGRHEILRRSSEASLPLDDIALAEAIRFPTEDGVDANAFFYAPRNARYRGPPAERPPLIVIGHGGPTSSTDPCFKWPIQFWTSRGFAVVDVNYGGSSGFGRAYRERLNGRWGEVDVDDSIAAARFLATRGSVDRARVVIRGSSAGGYTTLAALCFRDFFRAGASYYGIGDLESLARDTHKFESRYLDRLVGPYPAQAALYRSRSPIHHTDRLARPMILFQGREDRVVPPAQAQAMFDAVDAKHLPVACLMFEGEQHGFRRAATIRRCLEAELYFYARVLGFEAADTVDPVDIRNLEL